MPDSIIDFNGCPKTNVHLKILLIVIPVQTGIQLFQYVLDCPIKLGNDKVGVLRQPVKDNIKTNVS
jgi:uncharacterized protein (DUF486 family)